ncbi:methyltransferase domain-containing protein [Actinacidiphila rubida]|uniref:Protein-L-isoaspartate O-methyltransferase n=1 Tax=Actinacidiphila rubida TaxID=310780 RepID=A0A1H8MDD2_9ACTN|nr:methyltransferase domain-containing protein [Actinacidiphila rubida]SEO15333.1 protein-L-isoaspartate(D-aspartate) O-methyltransferase [Actinacidiphila rubida]
MTNDLTATMREAFAGALGDGRPSTWRDAFAAVPREIFVPTFHRQDERGRWHQVTEADEGFLNAVYSDSALMTQLDERGIPTSSSSEPCLMLTMLDALDARIGDNVFELGAGTGYNAALLSHRLGSENVTSVDVDDTLVKAARERLHSAGYDPFLFAGDGTQGRLDRAPYARIIATAALTSIPPALVRQADRGGVIVAPIGLGIVRTTVSGPGHAEGDFLPPPALFMPQRTTGGQPAFDALPDRDPETSEVPVADVLNRLRFPLSLALPGYQSCSWRDGHGALTGVGLWTDDGSTASASATGAVRQTGPRRLWDTVEGLVALFPEGQPAREEFRLTVAPHEQRVRHEPSGASWALPLG